MYNDEWMRAKGFFEVSGMTARDLLAKGVSGEPCAVEASQPIEVAIRVMGEHDFSQIGCMRGQRGERGFRRGDDGHVGAYGVAQHAAQQRSAFEVGFDGKNAGHNS